MMTARVRFLAVFLSAALSGGCSLSHNEPFVRSTLVALGDSMTMGIQDAGLLKENQLKCYPYIVAKQMGQARGFMQPYAEYPGIGVYPYKKPLWIKNGMILSEEWPAPPDPPPTQQELMDLIRLCIVQSMIYPDPFNNLGVNGARLDDLNIATGYATSSSGENYFYDIVLRNQQHPYFGNTTAVQQAAMLKPEYILLWIGNNDILGYVLSGGEKPERITTAETFNTELRAIVEYLQDPANTTAKIVIANIPEYLPFGYALDSVFVDATPRLFNPRTLQPINFAEEEGDPPVYKQLHVEDDETVKHILLTGAADYIKYGKGIYPSELSEEQEKSLKDLGVTIPSGDTDLTSEFVLTDTEKNKALNTIQAFNDIIETVAPVYGLTLVDANSEMQPATIPPPAGDPMAFVLISQDNTRYSLDGIHPSNYGHAFIANLFIDALNSFGLNLPNVDPESLEYRGQYSGKALLGASLQAIQGLRKMYAPAR
jgi:lysophospholipase L1-like esterase